MSLEYGNSLSSFVINEHHLIKKHQIYCLQKLHSRELYNMGPILEVQKAIFQTYFEKNFQKPELECKETCTIPRHVTVNTNICIFQYKLLHNILNLNEIFEKNGKRVSPLCFICMEQPESPIHLFHSSAKANFLWMQLQYFFQNVLIIPPITPQTSIFGFTDHKANYHLINHILLISTCYVYKTRENGLLELKILKRNIHKTENIEKQISLHKPEKQKQLIKNGNLC